MVRTQISLTAPRHSSRNLHPSLNHNGVLQPGLLNRQRIVVQGLVGERCLNHVGARAWLGADLESNEHIEDSQCDERTYAEMNRRMSPTV